MLWDKIEKVEKEAVITDYCQPYQVFIPTAQHVQSKAETYTIEGYNSIFRHFLSKIRRKTKSYSKSMKMLLYSVKLLMEKWNGQLYILN